MDVDTVQYDERDYPPQVCMRIYFPTQEEARRFAEWCEKELKRVYEER